ncbi:Serpentine Receptor, class J [Caenorhabditis elegans]|uniref:Serpentine Receptor, class J n=1 Tax=Caenorhabditis elegans TaxID=6239 RepID=Q23625_CAEEL|nr:Serpentine Receptor, class J [Caenorhabditis elegans]CAA98078.1 Serpentine Receptor, class J [Caenorhabditis elegans]|eukprot:NP_502270.1 Serpentine Receptor, class J [Caenorhabditis elegans]
MIYMSWFHTWSPRIFCVLSFIFNILFLVLLKFKSPRYIGGYRYLLMTFGVFNLITSVTEAVVSTAIEGFNNCLIIFVPHGLLFEYPLLAQNLISIRCGMCAYTFALLAVHFLYRYLAVCRPLAIAHFFRPKTIFLNSLFVMCFGSSWMLIGHITMWPDDHIYDLIDEKFIQFHNTSSRDLAMIVANYEYPVYDWSKSGILGMLIATLITTSIMISYVFFAQKIHLSLKACTFSGAVKRLHSSLLKSLIAQTIIPLISTIIPCFVIWFLPLGGDNYGVMLSTYFMPLLSVYPAIDPVVITCSLSDYRNSALKTLGFQREEISTSKQPYSNIFTVIPSLNNNYITPN